MQGVILTGLEKEGAILPENIQQRAREVSQKDLISQPVQEAQEQWWEKGSAALSHGQSVAQCCCC